MHDKIQATAGKDSGAMSKQINSRESEVSQRQGMESNLTTRAAAVLQRMVGNRGVGQVLQAMQSSGSGQHSSLNSDMTVQRAEKPNNTGLPDQLKSGIENLSGYSMDDVKVHYNSSKPPQLNAYAYAQGNEIHIAPGQEQHLPHEAWHVVQQRQGRVQPTMQLKGVEVNDNEALEKEATELGNRAMEFGDHAIQLSSATPATSLAMGSPSMSVAQLMLIKVKTKRGEGGRYISSVEFEGRVPTSAKSGQGDHTVADFLPKLMLESNLIGITHAQAAELLPKLFNDIDAQTQTKFKNDDGKMIKVTLDTVIAQLDSYRLMTLDPMAEGEDLNEALENVMDGYLRLWNKRVGAAYKRDEGKTTGGGGGQSEKEAKKQIIALGNTAHEMGGDERSAISVVPSLLDSIDFAPKTRTQETLIEASRHLTMAMELLFKTSEELEFNGSDIMYNLVSEYAQKVGLNKDEVEELLRHSFNAYYDEDYDDYEDYEDDQGMEVEDRK